MTSATLTQREFAKHLGMAPSYVTQLKKDGRLVMESGRVRVAESLARIEATADPAKAPVADRHAAARAGEAAEPERRDYQDARAKREHYAALQAELDYRKAAGELLEAAAVVATLADILAVLRSGFESFPDILAPQLAPVTDESLVRARLADEVEILLGQVSERFAEMGGGNEKLR